MLRGISSTNFDESSRLIFINTARRSMNNPPPSTVISITSFADVVTAVVSLLESSISVNYQVSFTVYGSASDAMSTFTNQSRYLEASISSGNFTKLLVSSALAANSKLSSVTSTSATVSSPTITTSVLILPTSTPTSSPSKTSQLPGVVSISASPLRTSIITTVTLSGPQKYQTSGFLYCFASSEKSLLSISFLKSYGVSLPFSNTSASSYSITLASLIPSNTYYIYCGIQASTGYQSTVASINQTSIKTKTKCCRGISFVTVPAYTYGSLSLYSSLASASYTYTISYLPESSVTVTPTLLNTSLSDTAPSLYSIIPPSYTFSPSSTSSVASFVISGSASSSGSYVLSLQITGSDSKVVSSYNFEGGAKSTILSSESPLPAPNMTTAIFSDNGAQVIVLFDVPTDQAGISSASFRCSTLFTFTNATVSTCSFVNASAIFVTFGTISAQYLVPGSSVTLKANLIRASCKSGTVCSKNAYASATTVYVKQPLTPLIPTIILSIPRVLGSCNNLSVDATGSKGFGGRVWKRVYWEVKDSSNGLPVPSIQSHLNISGSNAMKLISVPSTLLGNATYLFSLTLTNFLGYSATGSSFVTVSGNANLPSLTINGGNSASFYPYQAVSMSCVAALSRCAQTSTITYTTRIFLNNAQVTSTSSSIDPRTFSLAPYMLQAGKTYSVEFTAKTAATSKYSATSTTITGSLSILSGKIVAVISGGSTRLIPVDSSFVLDASSSYDENVVSPTLTYKWSCSVQSPTSLYGTDCSNILSTKSFSSTTVPSLSMNTSYTYKVEVLVSAVDGRTSTTSVNIQAIASRSVVITLSKSSSIVNAGDKLTLSSTLFANYSSSVNVTAYWEVYYQGNIFAASANTPSTQYFTSLELLKRVNFPLAYASNTFIQGRSYTFRLTAYPSFDPSLKSYAESSIAINSPPFGGIVTVDPSVGSSLSTLFSVSTSLWESDNIPLQYAFTYQLSSDLPPLKIGSLSSLTAIQTTLPAGLSSRDNLLAIIVTAYDTLQASSSSATIATVNLVVKSDSAVSSLLSTSLSTSFSSGNIDGAIQVVNNVASTVSIVNCSATTVAYCSSLNRKSCDTIPNTCGNCLSGFTGIVGYANTKCFLVSTNTQLGTVGSSCATNEDCIYGKCVDFRCALPTKSCPSSLFGSECSGYGTCSYFDTSNVQISTCPVTSSTCYSKCVCTSGYSGSDCSLDQDSATQRDSLRSQLCSAIVSLYSVQGESASTLQSLSGSLLASFQPDEVTSIASLQNCFDALLILTDLASQGYLKNLPSSTLDVLTSSVSSFISNAASLQYDSSTEQINEAHDQLTEGVLQTMVDGESSTNLIGANFQTAVSRPRLSDLYSAVIAPPLTDAEIAYSSASPKIILSSDGLSACDTSNIYAQFSVTKYSKNPNLDSDEVKTSGLKFSSFRKRVQKTRKHGKPSQSPTSISALSLRDEEFSQEGRNSRKLSVAEAVNTLSFTPAYFIVLQFSSKQNFNFSLDLFSSSTSYLKYNYTLPECTLYDPILQQNIPCSGCNISSFTNTNVTFGCSDLSLLCYLGQSSTSSSQSSRRLGLFDDPKEQAYLSKLLNTDHSAKQDSRDLESSEYDYDDYFVYYDDYGRTGDDDGGTNNKITASQFGAIAKLIAAEIVSVVTSNPFALNAAQSLGILSLIGAICFMILIGCLIFKQWDHYDRILMEELQKLRKDETVKLPHHDTIDFDLKKIFKDRRSRNIFTHLRKAYKMSKTSLSSKSKSDKIEDESVERIDKFNSPFVGEEEAVDNPLSVKKDPSKEYLFKDEAANKAKKTKAIVFDFLETVTPTNFLRDINPWIRVPKLVLRIHDMTGMFYMPSLQLPRFVRWFSCIRGILIGLFCDTLLFGIFFPDTGYCETFTTRNTCIANYNEATARPTCIWSKEPGDDTFSCSIRNPPSSFTFTALLALITVIMGVPLDIFIGAVLELYGRKTPRLDEIGISSKYWIGRKIKTLTEQEDQDISINDYDEKSQLHKLLEDVHKSQEEIHRKSRKYKKYLGRMSEEAYNDACSPEEEFRILAKKVKVFLEKNLYGGDFSWSGKDHLC